jgi:hypothetical protein
MSLLMFFTKSSFVQRHCGLTTLQCLIILATTEQAKYFALSRHFFFFFLRKGLCTISSLLLTTGKKEILCTVSRLLQQPVRRKYFVLHLTFALHFFIIVATIGQEEKFFTAFDRFCNFWAERKYFALINVATSYS